MIKLFVDDIRTPPSGDWVVCRTYSEAIHWLEHHTIDVISLDHDLGEEKTGYDVVCWIEKMVYTEKYFPPKILVHSANPVGRDNILNCVRAIKKYLSL